MQGGLVRLESRAGGRKWEGKRLERRPDPDLPGKKGVYVYLDEPCIIHPIVKPLYCTHVTNAILYSNDTGIKKEGAFDSKYAKNPEDCLSQGKERLRVILVGGGRGRDLGR